jgi:hypothetical protein
MLKIEPKMPKPINPRGRNGSNGHSSYLVKPKNKELTDRPNRKANIGPNTKDVFQSSDKWFVFIVCFYRTMKFIGC